MNFSDGWKSLFTINSTHPLFLPSSQLGPLCFNPNHQTLTQLFNSHSLSPPLLNPPPTLSLPRFLSTSSPECPIPYSISSSIASDFGFTSQHDPVSPLLSNRLQLLQCVDKNIVIVFFTTGENNDQVGYLVVSVKEGALVAQGNQNGDVLTTNILLNHRIIKILVSPIDDVSSDDVSSETVGVVMAVTMYSVQFFSVVVNLHSTEKPVVLCYLGSKPFSSLIVSACWSPYLPNECVVLLESGELYLLDCLESNELTPKSFKGTRLRVKWNHSDNCKWLGCVFSWHPRNFIVASTDTVYQVDMREDKCSRIKVLLKTENEKFLALSNAASDSFHFILATSDLLRLCDVRKPLFTTVLQWAHCLDKPCYIDVFRLSNLRSHSRDGTYKKGTESGFGIFVGSFFNCEFGLFCYGPPFAQKGSVTSGITEVCKSLYAWELPSNLWLSGRGCPCGSCIKREEVFKDSLPEWVDWQQRKEIVLGFGVLDNDLSAMLSEPDEFGGFTLIRLLSSGKLEAQRYCASWDLVKKSEVFHKDLKLDFGDTLLYFPAVEDYKFRKSYKYLNLDYLYAHLDDSLFGVLNSKMKRTGRGLRENESFGLEFHEVLCQKLNICGFDRFRTAPAISAVFNDINLPTSIREVALRRAWAGLPIELLHLAFSSYAEFREVLLDSKKVSLEFLVVPELAQLPPFFLRKHSNRSNKWSQKVQPNDNTLVGPVLPLAVLLNLHELYGRLNSQNGVTYSSEAELSLQCNAVKQVAKERAVGDSSASELLDDHVVSLGGDNEQMLPNSEKSKSFVLHRPATFERSDIGCAEGSKFSGGDMFSTFISKVRENDPSNIEKMEADGLEGFDSLCPFMLKFETPSMDLKSQEWKGYDLLKRQFSRWQKSFDPYQSFCKHDGGSTHEECCKAIKQEIVINEEQITSSKIKNHSKRKLEAMVDDGYLSMPLRQCKRILLSVSRPSYGLVIGAQNVRFANKERLHVLLRKIMMRHNWAEGCGVLSVLLQGTSRDRCPVANRSKFLASLGLLKHVQGHCDNSTKIKHIYDIWMKRINSTKDQRLEDRLMVHLEFIITFLTRGYVDEAYQGVLSLKLQKEFGSHPMSYMVMGLTHYQLLYSGLRKAMQWENSDQFYPTLTPDIPGLVNNTGNIEWHDSVYSENADTHVQCDSVVSVKNGRSISIENESNPQIEISVQVDANLQIEASPAFVQALSSYHNSEDSEASRINDQMDYTRCASNFSILVKEGLDPWLFPVRCLDSVDNNEDLIQMHGEIVNNDHYKDAVKYLRLALHSKPLVLPALLPLIQLLLIGGQVHEALSELEKLSSSSNAASPSRSRVMECYYRNNDSELVSCFEDNLKKDPTCNHSLAKLIGIHQRGNYKTESLLEMIALHLDGTYAEHNTWKEFAECFLRVSEYDDDLLSVCLNENAERQSECYSVRYNRVPSLFTKWNSKTNWIVRCKWWMRRHFNRKMFASESAAAGDLQLLAYKAACASHMYGQDFHYVVTAHECLQKEKSTDLLKFLVRQMKNSIGLYSSFQSGTKS